MSEEEKKAIERINNLIKGFRRKENKQSKLKKDLWCYFKYRDYEATEILLNLVDKRQKEAEEYTKFKKDIVNKIMIWDKEELPDNKAIIEMIDTLMSEVSRLEDIEDKKVMVAIDLIEEKRDKFWKDKIKNKIEQLKEIADEDNPDIYIKIDAYEELLEEK